MKKILLLTIAVSIASAITSCKKEYTCLCYGGANGTTENSDYFNAASKEKAGEICAKYWTESGDSGCVLIN